ncbi:MAG: hypothetical protein OXD49_03540 [Candidatus Poribacteria bacterium]|nr:hypothetical protein [Candidatus Poribacteria bacterium]
MKKLIEGIIVRPSGGTASARLPIPGVSGTVVRASPGSSIFKPT